MSKEILRNLITLKRSLVGKLVGCRELRLKAEKISISIISDIEVLDKNIEQLKRLELKGSD